MSGSAVRKGKRKAPGAPVATTPESILDGGAVLDGRGHDATPDTAELRKVVPLNLQIERSLSISVDDAFYTPRVAAPAAVTPNFTLFRHASSGSKSGSSAASSGLDFESPATTTRGAVTTPRVLGTPFDREPPSAPRAHKTMSLTPAILGRTSSLDETKVLATTSQRLLRSESVIDDGLFRFTLHFEFVSIIGRSEHSEVWLARHRDRRGLFAVKRRRFSTRADRERCLREMVSVAELPPHPNVCYYVRCWQEDSEVLTQMEYCERGDLKRDLGRRERGLLPFPDLLTLTAELASGLEFLDAHKILHLDIKPENVYIDGAGTYHIGDFGLAVVDEKWDWEEGDGRYLAPELLQDDCTPTTAADIYSLGVMLVECATGKLLPRNRATFSPRMVVADLRSVDAPEDYASMLRDMLAQNPLARPTATKIRRLCERLAAA